MPLPEESKLIDERGEKVVLAGLMRAPDLNVRRVRFMLRESDFSFSPHAWLYGQCLRTWDAKRCVPLPLDEIYKAMVGANGKKINIQDFGCKPLIALVDIYQSDPTGAWCYGRAKRVCELAERRRIIYAARVRIRDAMDGLLTV